MITLALAPMLLAEKRRDSEALARAARPTPPAQPDPQPFPRAWARAERRAPEHAWGRGVEPPGARRAA